MQYLQNKNQYAIISSLYSTVGICIYHLQLFLIFSTKIAENLSTINISQIAYLTLNHATVPSRVIGLSVHIGLTKLDLSLCQQQQHIDEI